MSTPAALRLAAAGAADAGKDTEMMRKRIEALRVQAASLMEAISSSSSSSSSSLPESLRIVDRDRDMMLHLHHGQILQQRA